MEFIKVANDFYSSITKLFVLSLSSMNKQTLDVIHCASLVNSEFFCIFLWRVQWLFSYANKPRKARQSKKKIIQVKWQ